MRISFSSAAVITIVAAASAMPTTVSARLSCKTSVGGNDCAYLQSLCDGLMSSDEKKAAQLAGWDKLWPEIWQPANARKPVDITSCTVKQKSSSTPNVCVISICGPLGIDYLDRPRQSLKIDVPKFKPPFVKPTPPPRSDLGATGFNTIGPGILETDVSSGRQVPSATGSPVLTAPVGAPTGGFNTSR
jgi:hypothetical protein